LDWELLMNYLFDSFNRIIPKRVLLILAACLLTGLLITLSPSSAHAVRENMTKLATISEEEQSCTPPDDWAQTTRVKNPERPTKQWTFTVDEAEMNVNLTFFYYQDHDKAGCPFDCSTGACQTDETGNGQTPLGDFSVEDGKEGANRGSKEFEGRLPQGTYQVTFTANGHPGSINVGLNVRQNPVSTETPSPTNTPVPPTATPTATESKVPPAAKPSPTPTSKPPKKKPPATLPPPTPFPGSPAPQVLIPQTGSMPAVVLGSKALVFIPLGFGLVGLGIAFYGIATRLKRK
jgi:hypothetical protein